MSQRRTIVELCQKKRLRVAGMMSGTSADGIDIAVVDITAKSKTLVAYGTVPYSTKLRKAVFELFDLSMSDTQLVCHYNFVLGEYFAKALIKFCRKNTISLSSIDLIGSHGQTIHHNPQGTFFAGKRIRSTLQIAEPSVIAQQTQITTVADFRPGDIACGGQGAPLVPFADYILFQHTKRSRILQNIGGISNLTYLPANGTLDDIIAFDTGPGNMVIDGLIGLISNNKKTYDHNGLTAAKGTVCNHLIKEMLKHPYFRKHPPKTCGREEFGIHYCQDLYKKAKAEKIHDNDLLMTATAFTAMTVMNAYRRFLPALPDEIILCGGGCHNKTLINILKHQSGGIKLLTTKHFGIDPDAKEAVSFAILAWATIKGIPNNIPSATGADKSAVLGKIVCTS
jgi:anhydro-N-acetylmuramic acid kinase